MAEQERRVGGRWHRFMLSMMGPAQVGPYDAAAPARDLTACDRCGTPWAEHEIVRSGSRSYPRCSGA